MTSGHPRVVETARLSLRRVTAGDAAFLCRLLNEPSWLKNIGDRGVRTPADAERYVQTKILPGYEQYGFGMYLIESKSDARPMGLCGLVRRDTLPDVDLGFALLSEFWGQGYAFEAASEVVSYARRSLGLSRLLAIALPANAPSVRLLGKLGFQYQNPIRLTPTDENLELHAITL